MSLPRALFSLCIVSSILFASNLSLADSPGKKDKPTEKVKKEDTKSAKKNEPTPAKKPEAKKPEAPKPEPKPEPKPQSALKAKPEPKPQPSQELPKPKPAPKPVPPQNHSKIAITDLKDVDEDFDLQGEYYGQIRLPSGELESVGIQVIARGDGNFVGRQLRGGLPGNGWDRSQKIDLEGQRSGTTLILRQGDYRVIIEGHKAVVMNSSGSVLGILMKVERKSKYLGLKPTEDAIVLFDGTTTEGFVDAKIDENGNLQMGTQTVDNVGDFRLHLEFRLPYMPYATGQGRANSGLYIQERYEVQILDSFGLPGVFNECGALYRTKSPDVNMCFPPLSWQSYDVYFTAARFDAEGKKIAPARISVMQNGILVQDNFEIPNKTGAGKPEGPEPRPIKLQDHGNPVVFRNIWIEKLGTPTVAEEKVEQVSGTEELPAPAKK